MKTTVERLSQGSTTEPFKVTNIISCATGDVHEAAHSVLRKTTAKDYEAIIGQAEKACEIDEVITTIAELLDKSKYGHTLEYAIQEIWRWALLGILLELRGLFDTTVGVYLSSDDETEESGQFASNAGFENVYAQRAILACSNCPDH